MTEVADGVNDEGFGDLNTEECFNYDIDLIKEESTFIHLHSRPRATISKKGTEDDHSDNEIDSAIHSPRTWRVPPVPEMKNNNVRSSTKSFVVSQRAITLKTLHKVELLRYRAWFVSGLDLFEIVHGHWITYWACA
ncbi:hypothetical protein COOONC_26483 [Cooperia oncophora]